LPRGPLFSTFSQQPPVHKAGFLPRAKCGSSSPRPTISLGCLVTFLTLYVFGSSYGPAFRFPSLVPLPHVPHPFRNPLGWDAQTAAFPPTTLLGRQPQLPPFLSLFPSPGVSPNPNPWQPICPGKGPPTNRSHFSVSLRTRAMLFHTFLPPSVFFLHGWHVFHNQGWAPPPTCRRNERLSAVCHLNSIGILLC